MRGLSADRRWGNGAGSPDISYSTAGPTAVLTVPKTGDGRGRRSSGSRDRSGELWGPASTVKRGKPQHSLSSLLSLWKIVLCWVQFSNECQLEQTMTLAGFSAAWQGASRLSESRPGTCAHTDHQSALSLHEGHIPGKLLLNCILLGCRAGWGELLA